MNRCGVRRLPMPDGVPEKMMSPGSRGRRPTAARAARARRRASSTCATACIPSPTSVHEIARSSRSANSSGVTSHGPVGPKPGNDLPRLNCGAEPCSCVIALRQVLPDREAGDVVPRALAVDLVRLAADHDDELDLPVDVALGQVDHGVRARRSTTGTS